MSVNTEPITPCYTVWPEANTLEKIYATLRDLEVLHTIQLIRHADAAIPAEPHPHPITITRADDGIFWIQWEAEKMGRVTIEIADRMWASFWIMELLFYIPAWLGAGLGSPDALLSPGAARWHQGKIWIRNRLSKRRHHQP